MWKLLVRGYHLSRITRWGRVTHICVSEVTIIVSDNGLSPGRHQAIIWNNAGILLIEPLGTNFSGILIEIHTFSFKKMHLKMSSGKWRPFCLGLNVIMKFHASHSRWMCITSKYIYFIYEEINTTFIMCLRLDGHLTWINFNPSMDK